MPDLPIWKFGDILERRTVRGPKNRVMFIRFDKDRAKMLGGGAVQFVGMRLDNNDRTNPHYTPIGRVDNYSLPGFQLVEDSSSYPDISGPFSGIVAPHGSGFYDASIFGANNKTYRIEGSAKNGETITFSYTEDIE